MTRLLTRASEAWLPWIRPCLPCKTVCKGMAIICNVSVTLYEHPLQTRRQMQLDLEPGKFNTQYQDLGFKMICPPSANRSHWSTERRLLRSENEQKIMTSAPRLLLRTHSRFYGIISILRSLPLASYLMLPLCRESFLGLEKITEGNLSKEELPKMIRAKLREIRMVEIVAKATTFRLQVRMP